MRALNFYFEFMEKGRLPTPFQMGSGDSDTSNSGVLAVLFIPPYADRELLELKPGYKAFYLPYHNGFYMDLEGVDSADSYLKQSLGSKVVKNLRRQERRLSDCGAVHLEVHRNQLSRDRYDRLMERMRTLISDRFEGLGVSHSALERWPEYCQHAYAQILKGNASLMVLSLDSTVIGMGLNYHYKTTLDSAMTTFSMDYEKYGVGQIMLLHKLRWALAQGVRLVDLRWGDLPHKRRLANRIMRYQLAIIFKRNSPVQWVKAAGLYVYLRLKTRLRPA